MSNLNKLNYDPLVYALDFETYYDSEYGISNYGAWGYVHHPKFDAYLISIVGDGIEYVGPPKEAPWHLLPAGWKAAVHNQGFERLVFPRCQELRTIPKDAAPAGWLCTLDLSAYLCRHRSLHDAVLSLYGVEVDKGMRDYMRGKTWSDAVTAGKAEELKKYALDDSRWCLKLYRDFNTSWPQIEQELSEITFQETARGVAINEKLLDSGIQNVQNANDEAKKGIPWFGEEDEKGKEVKPLSVLALKKFCLENGCETKPPSTEDGDPLLEAWLSNNEHIRPVIKAMQTYRSTNALLKKACTIRARIRPDGTFPHDLKYGGAHTLRWSGGWDEGRAESGSVNVQNLPGSEMYGLHLRKCFVPRPGFKFIGADYSQIEPRCLWWLVGDWETLALIKQGLNPYEAYSRKNLGWDGGSLKALAKAGDAKALPIYKTAKAAVLGAGYGCGAEKFITVAKQMADLNITLPEAERIVAEFRRTNPKITKFWKTLENGMRRSIGEDYLIELPSWRSMRYRNVKVFGGLTCQVGDKIVKTWGGKLCENVTQAVARDVIGEALVRLEKAGIRTLFTVHDEVICEVPLDFDNKIVEQLMIEAPDWLPGIPLEVEIKDMEYYK